MVAAILALLASFSWGTSDFLAGLESRRSTAWTVALGGQVVASLSLIALLLAMAPDRPRRPPWSAPAVGGADRRPRRRPGYRALALVDMSVVSPIIAGAALVPVLWGRATGERPGALQVARHRLSAGGDGPDLAARADGSRRRRARVDRTGILMAIVCAAALGLFLVALGYGDKAEPAVHGDRRAHHGRAHPARRRRRHPPGGPAAPAALPALAGRRPADRRRRTSCSPPRPPTAT